MTLTVAHRTKLTPVAKGAESATAPRADVLNDRDEDELKNDATTVTAPHTVDLTLTVLIYGDSGIGKIRFADKFDSVRPGDVSVTVSIENLPYYLINKDRQLHFVANVKARGNGIRLPAPGQGERTTYKYSSDVTLVVRNARRENARVCVPYQSTHPYTREDWRFAHAKYHSSRMRASQTHTFSA